MKGGSKGKNGTIICEWHSKSLRRKTTTKQHQESERKRGNSRKCSSRIARPFRVDFQRYFELRPESSFQRPRTSQLVTESFPKSVFKNPPKCGQERS